VTKELTVIERAAVALGTSERENSLRLLVTQSESIIEIKNTAGRDQCHSAAMSLRTARTNIRKTGKDARDDATKFSKAVIAEEDRLVAIIEPEETRLIALRDEWDERVAAEKLAKLEAEARRIAAIREHIDDIRAIVPRCAGMTSDQIQTEIQDLVTLQIDVPRFAELTGDAELVRGEMLDKLRGMHAKALEAEAEARRIAEESARLAHERAAFEEEQRKAAAARAEQERKDAEARAAREAEERARREAEEVARREKQAREDAERRAAIEAEEKRLAAERAEMARRQAELDRAEAERREREEKATREMAEAAANAERERVQRERAENRAALVAPEPTGGEWFAKGSEVQTTIKLPGAIGTGHCDEHYYGSGSLIAESIARPADARLIAAAPRMRALLKLFVEQITHPANADHTLGAFSHGARIAEALKILAELEAPIEHLAKAA
jgi:hypothetical protein